MRGWFIGTCGPSTRSIHHLVVSQQNPEVSHACWNVRLRDTADTSVMQWSLMWGREDRPALNTASLIPDHPWTTQPEQQTDIPSSQELCFHHWHCKSGLWQQFNVFPPNITTLLIVLYTNSILLPFTQLNKCLWWRFLEIRQEKGLICKSTHIKEEWVVHRKRKLHMSKMSWTVVEVLIAGGTDLVDAGHRKMWDTPQQKVSPAWFQGGTHLFVVGWS